MHDLLNQMDPARREAQEIADVANVLREKGMPDETAVMVAVGHTIFAEHGTNLTLDQFSKLVEEKKKRITSILGKVGN